MTRMARHLSIHAVIFLSIMLFLQATAEDETASTESSKGTPFLQSEAENWSFQNQIQKSIPEYLKRVETNAKNLMRTRYKFGRNVKIPEYFTDLESKAPPKVKLNGTVHFVDGWAHGFPNISLAGESTVVYEESTIKFHSDVNFWKTLVFVYEYNILENCKDFKGQIKVNIKDARYSLTAALDIPVKGMALTDFKKKGVGVGDVHVDGLEGNSRLSRILVPIFSGFYQDTVFPDIEAAMRTILEDSFKNVSVRGLLPKADYKMRHPDPKVEREGLETCDTDAETFLEEKPSLWEPVTDVPFIQNTAEMWAFQKQMNNGLNQLMKQLSVRTTKHLAERELLRGKLADQKFLMSIKDQTSTTRHAPMSLSGGWFSSPFKFNVSGIRQVEFRDGAVIFTASFHLEDPIEFVHDYHAAYLRVDYEGDVRGSVKFVEYALNFSLDLETAVLTLEDPMLDCVRDISIVITGLDSEEEWFSSELKRNVRHRFEDSALSEIHTVVSEAFYYVTSVKTAEQYLPKWSYKRNFRTDFELRLGENDEDMVEICDEERILTAEERLQWFSELIGEGGVFNDSISDERRQHFTKVSGIKNFSIRYTSTRTQTWHFDRELRVKMNEYMYNLLKTTEDIIRIRDLGKVRMPDYKEAGNDKYDGELRVEKCWIDGLGSVAVTGVDFMEYDQKVITLVTNIQVYKDLKYEGEYVISRPRGRLTRGSIVAQLPPMEISLRIDIDYLGEKTAKLDYMKLECVGEKSCYTSPHSRVDRVSDSVDGQFREVMVEQLVQIFRRAFEDAMVDTKWENFMPKWDYKRDYISEIISHEKQNRFQIGMDVCNSTEGDKPTLKEYNPDEETVNFSRFLPEIKMIGLRRSFQRQIHVLMTDAVNSMWRNIVNGPLQRLTTLRVPDSGLSLESEDSKGDTIITSVSFSVIDSQGLTSGSYLDEVDFKYGKEDTLIILYQQWWDSIKIFYNVSAADYPNGKKDYGTAEATAEGLQYLLKVRFFLSNSTFSIDEFYLKCLRNLSVTVQGLRPEREWIADSVKDSVKSSFPGSELLEIKEFLFILYGYAAAELDMRLYTYSWTYDRDLFKIAAEKKEGGKQVWREKARRACKEEEKRGNRTVIVPGDVPFIGSEAEWWSFSRQTKGQIDRFKKEVRKVAREFIRDHDLQRPLIPDLQKNFARETNEESDTVVCKLTEGVAGDLLSVKYADDTMVDVGKDVKITFFITFESNLKFRYRLEARSEKEVSGGRVLGVAKSLIYKMVMSVDKEKKSANLESFEFDCMSDIEINATIAKSSFWWVKDMMPEGFRDDFTSLVMFDVRKILKMAFTFAAKSVNVLPYVEDWNYQKDYGERSKSGKPKKMRGLSCCKKTSN